MFTNFNFQQILSAFIVLFAVIDIIGAIPIIIDLKDKGKDVNASVSYTHLTLPTNSRV